MAAALRTAMSTSPLATTAAEPLDDPPAEKPGLRGLITGPVAAVTQPPDRKGACWLKDAVPDRSEWRAKEGGAVAGVLRGAGG